MDKNYIKSTELWIGTMEVQLKQKQDNLEHIKSQIALWDEEKELLTKQINHDYNWLKEAVNEFEEYKKANQ